MISARFIRLFLLGLGLWVIQLKKMNESYGDHTFCLSVESGLSTLVDRSVVSDVGYATVGGADDAASGEAEFFVAVGTPAHDTGHGKEGSVDFNG